MLDLDMSFRKAAVMHVEFPKREHSFILPGGTVKEGASHRLPRKVVWINGESLHLVQESQPM